ncbi:nuclear receptor coactivator 7 isoform X1 [Gadus chalcogrammus]|uniref:nuclear receptor coactivator 7 isoform X1 n=1 Tax=Gadus chalcogrammus TaxID=1042646 RepID=UPI0024C20FA5|nr:nuclear receptor coactivator 7 isoform X1 [Gadus chalcogrammus]XP_056446401.1 nuclear receptor coactivator 7 isoform X1 [Gadus chalcogrammus]
MAQSMRRSTTLGTMDPKVQRDTARTGYFGNVKNRLGSKLAASASQELSKSPLGAGPGAGCGPRGAGPGAKCGPLGPEPEAPGARCGATEARPGGGRPFHAEASGAVHHIRNPKLRQYYLQGSSSECQPARQEGPGCKTPHNDTVFSITSQSDVQPAPPSTTSSSSTPEVLPQMGKQAAAVPSPAELRWSGADQGTTPGPEGTPPGGGPSPSPDAEYDKLLDVEAVPMPDGKLCLLTLPPECCQGEGPEAVPYLKLFCRYITDCKGVVSGILLVTSTKLFFDPCKAHPLVVEHGWEEYLLSVSLERLASVSLYSDISHVRFSQSQHRWRGKKSSLRTPPPGVCDSLTSSTTTKQEVEAPALASSGPSGPSGRPSGEDGGSADTSEAGKPPQSGGPPGTHSEGGARDSAGASDPEPKKEEESGRRRLLAAPGSRAPGGPGALMFVRLRTLEKEKTPAGPQRAGGPQPGGDAWLALSQESSEQLFSYLSRWRPETRLLEGEEEERDGDACEEEFVLIEDDEEEHRVAKSDRHAGEDWEMLSIENGGSQPALLRDPEDQQTLPRDPEGLADILEASCILEASHVTELCTELPPRTIGHAWQLTYSTSCHGFSLKSLYRRLRASDSPALIVIKDALDQVFGSFLSHPLRPSDTFYGTGETFLFMLHPRFKCFRWTGENTFFIKGNLDSFAIGGGSGHFGLWLDETLYRGRSQPCYTFNNCCLSEEDDFHVIAMEVWTFN